MVERLKSWESPRKRGRNNKGKGGSARARQLRKREKMLLKRLKRQEIKAQKQNKNDKSQEGELFSLYFFAQYKLQATYGEARNRKELCTCSID